MATPPTRRAIPGLISGVALWLLSSAVAADVEGLYYDQNGVQRAYFTGSIVTRVDPNIDFNFGNGSPATGIGNNDFSVIWSGEVEAASSEPYTFETVSDDGVRLYVDNVLVIDNFTDHAPTTDRSAPINLIAGQRYPIRMEFYERGGGAVARLRWETPTIAVEAIPPANLFVPPFTAIDAAQACGTDEVVIRFSRLLDQTTAETAANYAVSAGATVASATLESSGTTVRLIVNGLDPGGHTITINNVENSVGDVIPANTQVTSAIPTNGLNGTYFDQNGVQRAYFTGNTVSRIDPVVDFNWGSSAPAVGIGANDFSVRWIGEVEAPESGNFRFRTRSDDGVRLFIDGDLVISNFTDHGPTTNESANIALTAGQRYQVIMEYYERGGGAVAELGWRGPSFGPQIIPTANLFPLCSLPPLPTAVAEWQSEQVSWTGAVGEVIDSTGNGHDGTALNGPNTDVATPAIAGDPGTCRYGEFEQASAQRVRIPYAPELNPDGDFTLAAWVRTTGQNRTFRSVFTSRWANNPTATQRRGYNIYAGSNNRWQFWTGNGRGGWDVVTGPAVQQGIWTHVVGTFQTQSQSGLIHRGIKRLYINGSLARSNGGRRYSPNTISDAFIGGGENNGGFFHFEGDLDEIHVFAGRLKDAEIMALMNETRPCQSPVDHYAITHALLGLTCEAEAVTITAHDATTPTHGAVEPNTTITISTDPPSAEILLKSGTAGNFIGGVGSAQYTFAAGETAVEVWLRQTTPATLDLDVIDANNIEESSAEDLPLEFRETMLRFAADGVANTIPNQIAGKISDPAPVLTLSVIETNTETGACQARLVPSPLDVELAFRCIDPNTCILPQGVEINGMPIAANPATGPLSYLPVSFNFSGTASAPFTLNYFDAGIISLHARLMLADTPPDPPIELLGNSNPFVVKPAGLCVQAPQADSGCATADVNCTRFRRAGDPFELEITGVAWETAGETDSDFCSGNVTTANFRLANITLDSTVVAPGGGDNGDLAVTSVDITNNGAVTVTTQEQSEVGIFNITADPDVTTYHGELIGPAASADIGRFYPAFFGLVVPTPPTVEDACTNFTYQDQPFFYDMPPEIRLTALNVHNDPTLNYTNDFFRLVTTLPRDYTDQSGAAATFDNPVEDTDVEIEGEEIFDGEALLKLDAGADGDEFVYERVSPEGPFTAAFDVEFEISGFTDPDDVCYDSDQDGNCESLTISGIGATELRFGRLQLTSAFGSDLMDLAIPVTAEYYDGSSFVPNTADSCTELDLADQVQLSNPVSGSKGGDESMTVGAGTSMINSGDPVVLAGGAGVLNFTAPGAGNAGFIDIVTALVDANPITDNFPWLLFNWDGGAAFDQDPTARASFGLFPGRREIIYIREPWD